MRIVIVSGKGGAGKTTVATRLFRALPGSVLLDCDVEEPNAALFLKAGAPEETTVTARFPVIDEEACINCGACAEFCAFGAILFSPSATIVMAERCHDCGGCGMVCPEKAIEYGERPVGTIYGMDAFDGRIAYGEMNIGEFSGVGIIKELKNSIDSANSAEAGRPVLIDGPPGTGCSTAEAVEGADFAILVTEPTPFGVSDMAMVAEMLETTGIPFGVVINKDDGLSPEAEEFCAERGIPLLGRIPFDRKLAEASALGRLEWGSPEHDRPFRDLADAAISAAGGAS